MKKICSDGNDTLWLAQQIKNKMEDKVSFNKFGLGGPILTGLWFKSHNTAPYMGKDDVRFFIRFKRGEWLRIQIEEGLNTSSIVGEAMKSLVGGISSINMGEEKIGFPLAVYRAGSSLSCEYAYGKSVGEILESLKTDTLFDDDSISEIVLTKRGKDALEQIESIALSSKIQK